MSAPTPAPRSRKLARTGMSAPFLDQMLKGNGRTAASNAPADLRVVDMYVPGGDQRLDPPTFWLICESESFAPVNAGDVPPDFTITFTEPSDNVATFTHRELAALKTLIPGSLGDQVEAALVGKMGPLVTGGGQ